VSILNLHLQDSTEIQKPRNIFSNNEHGYLKQKKMQKMNKKYAKKWKLKIVFYVIFVPQKELQYFSFLGYFHNKNDYSGKNRVREWSKNVHTSY
jgi:hypothetical protein